MPTANTPDPNQPTEKENRGNTPDDHRDSLEQKLKGSFGRGSGGDGGGNDLIQNIISAVVIFVLIAGAYALYQEQTSDVEEVPISELAQLIEQGEVEEIVVEGREITATLENDEEITSQAELGASISETLTNYGIELGELDDLTIDVKSPSGVGYWLIQLAPFLIPLLFIGFFIWFLSRQMRGGKGMQAFTFGKSRARFVDPEDTKTKITFDDVAGVKEAKQELLEIVEFLKEPKKFLDIGAEIPKGVILMGEPGTGKTLLARAVAGEANVPFFSISGSEFVEMFVGVGASRVRDMFETAKNAAPAIIFVDEIDAVGRTRGSGVGGGNDEREQTLNQILTEMDGFEPNEKVIVMAATNRPDVLDPALLRPGRFDRRVKIDPPDINDREAILEIHATEKPLAEDVKFRVIAERTPGFTGADIYSLVNEAAITAARDDRHKVSQFDFIQSIEKVMLGPERQSHLLNEKEKKVTAYHEAGHAVVGSVLENTHPVHKVSIISRGRAAGYTLHLPTEETNLKTRSEFLDELALSLGGYVAELMIFNDLTTGPSNDLKMITKRARAMVTRYGMSEDLGPIALETDEGEVLYGQYMGNKSEYSEEVGAKIDAEVSKFIAEARRRAKQSLEEHEDLLHAIAEELMENETIEREDFDAMLRAHGVKPKQDDASAGE